VTSASLEMNGVMDYSEKDAMSIVKIKWVLVRIVYFYIYIAMLSGFGMVIFAPIITYYFFGDIRFWRYSGYFFPIMRLAYLMTYLMFRDRKYSFHRSLPLTAPPLTGPDPAKVRVSDQWQHDEKSCNSCIRCCLKLNCPFLDLKENKCAVYDSVYWRYFNCGRFPLSQEHIDFYECRKWEMKRN